jgi:hypothetical protein
MWTSALIDEGYYWIVDLADPGLDPCMIECLKISNCLHLRFIDCTNWIPIENMDGYRYKAIEKPIPFK